jgi:hypothetical protein
VTGCARREVCTMQTDQPSSHSDQARRPGPYPTHRGRISASAPPCTPPCTRTQREGRNSHATARNCATARAQRLATTMLLLLLLLTEMQAANATSRPRAVPDRLSLSPSRGDRCAPEHADRTGHPCQPLLRAQQPFQHHTGVVVPFPSREGPTGLELASLNAPFSLAASARPRLRSARRPTTAPAPSPSRAASALLHPAWPRLVVA